MGHALLGENPLKLGVFAANLDGGLTASTVPERHRLSWANVKAVSLAADEAGFELQVPLARWKSLGGVTEFNGRNYDAFSWAAGVGAVTERSNIFSTVHVPIIHPIVAAKQMTSIDHITNGRFGLNLVCGWFGAEFAMFGSPMMGHADRYDYAAEWLEVVEALWTREEEFDFEGRFFKIEKGWQQPKPLTTPRPPIMNAGSSEVGARFAAKHADIAFLAIVEGQPLDEARARFDRLRNLARTEFSREIQIWSGCWVICRPTEREAREYYDYVIHEHGDMAVLNALPPEVRVQDPSLDPETARRLAAKPLGGWGGHHLVGTPEQIAEQMNFLSRVGVDGLMLSWVDYQEGIATWTREVMPLLEQQGLRKPMPRL